MSGPQQVSAYPEEILYEAVHSCEALHLGGRLEAPHLTLALPSRLMGNFGSIVGVLVRGVDHGRHHGPTSRCCFEPKPVRRVGKSGTGPPTFSVWLVSYRPIVGHSFSLIGGQA